MGVDRPGDYVGNHGGAYTDNDGMSKQFTYIDHDIKIKMPRILGENAACKEWQELYDDIQFEDPKVIKYLNHEWGTSHKKITDEIIYGSYLPLYLLRELKKLTEKVK